MKLYYDAQTGYLCDRYPKGIQKTDSSPYIEISDEEAEKTYSSEGGKVWAVKEGKLQLIDDTELLNSSKYQIKQLNLQINQLKGYLKATDYIIAKIAEAKAENLDADVTEMLSHYAEVLNKRKEARTQINQLQDELKAKQ